MNELSRRNFGKIALGSVPAALFVSKTGQLFAAPKPNSKINGVQIGVITYSYGRMPDQSAEATLQYVVDSGVNAIELMDGPVWSYAQKRTGFTPTPIANAGRGPGGGGGRGRGSGGPAGEAASGSWQGKACSEWGSGMPGPPPQAAAGAQQTGQQTAQQTAGAAGAQQTPQQTAGAAGRQMQMALSGNSDEVRKWRQGLSMDIFKDLRKMYNDAGVTMYAVKILNPNSTDEDLDVQFTIGKTLGATHLTTELIEHSDTSAATLKRVGDIALKHGMFAGYHSHGQGKMDAFDEAFAASDGNKANIDFGHYVAAGNIGGTPIDFLNKYHDRVASFHLKDRTLPEHCALNLAWGQGETPIVQILQLVQKNKWPIPATIELEYRIPEGSDSVKEVAKCLAYCRDALTGKTA